MTLQASSIEDMVDYLNRAKGYLNRMLRGDVSERNYKGVSQLITDIQDLKLDEFIAEVDRLIMLDQNIKKLVERLDVKNRS